jgi:transcriptional regulator with XRE-family HTH domain
MKEFKDLLKAYMDRNRFTYEGLAEKLALSKATISNWCNGKVEKIGCDKIQKCVEVLNLSPDERIAFMRAAKCLPSEKDAPLVPIVNIPIHSPQQFFGRKKELKRIFERWQHLPLHHFAIIGPRKSGKTSLLHYVKNIHTATQLREGQRQDYLPSAYQFVFVDFQGAGMSEEERLLTYILKALNLTVPSPCRLSDFIDVMRYELHKPTVLLFDRIDIGLQAEALNYQFWWGIRSLVINDLKGRLGLLVASPQLPTELIPKGADNQPSPFLNIFADVLTLGPFEESEARELLHYSPQPLDEAEAEWILENSGRWPVLLQMLCDVRLMALGETGEGWKAEGLKRIELYQYLL